MKHIIKLLNTSLKRLDEGDIETTKAIIKQALNDLQSTPTPVKNEFHKEKNFGKESFKEYFITLIKDLKVTVRDEHDNYRSDANDTRNFFIKEYRDNNNRILMEYLEPENTFYIYQRTMGISSTFLLQNTDIEIYGGVKRFHIVVQAILRDFYNLPVDKIEIYQGSIL